MQYELIVTKDHAGRVARTRLVDPVTSPSGWVTGDEVDLEGARLPRRHLIDPGTIRKRVPLVMSKQYGTLVDARTAR